MNRSCHSSLSWPPFALPVLSALVAGGLVALAFPAVASTASRPGTGAGQVTGVTVTDTVRLGRTLDAIRHLSRPVTVRLVLDPGPLGRYHRPARRLARTGRVMAEPVDSSGMSRLGVRRYRQRFRTAIRLLGRSVDAWEVGNEVNGSWTGPRRRVADKVRAALRLVRSHGGQSALTLYYNRGCRSRPSELDPLAWSRRMLTARIRSRLDFVYLSYYETECENRRPTGVEWRHQFRRLHRLYPKARLGFGETGLPRPATTVTVPLARSIINRYYRMDIHLPYFTGGGFWWYFVQDMTPWQTSPLFRTLRRAIRR